ncbi:MAG: hypothetical protein KGI97_04480 [Alphaproteobacteria bacterium]|nr:hypothetical protein [Alphaproteobacteria bacterium]
MKYALIGTGKTGQAIRDAIPERDLAGVFNTRNPATVEGLRQADAGIVFVPGPAFAALMPVLLDSRLPLVIGTTGFAWPDDLDARLKSANTAWIVGSNFSLGLNVMRFFAQRIKTALDALKPGGMKLGIAEKHHIHKLDAPSGTALYLAQALGFPAQDIAVAREGDAKGTHTVSFALAHDAISITHEAHDRAAFAEGVLLACDKIGRLPPGLHIFETLVDDILLPLTKG